MWWTTPSWPDWITGSIYVFKSKSKVSYQFAFCRSNINNNKRACKTKATDWMQVGSTPQSRSHLYDMMGFIEFRNFQNCAHVASSIFGNGSLKWRKKCDHGQIWCILYIQNVFKLSKINLFYAEKKMTQFWVPPKNPLLVTSFAPV